MMNMLVMNMEKILKDLYALFLSAFLAVIFYRKPAIMAV
jgi:hypothetical protein